MPSNPSSARPPQPVGRMRWLLALLGLGLVLVIVCVGPGCGTIANHMPTGHSQVPYGGIAQDFKAMGEKPAFIPIIFLDVPFSFIGDTIYLYSDISAQPKPPAKLKDGNQAAPPVESH